MRDLAKNIRLPSIDDLFSTEEERQDAKLEKIQILPLSELHPFEGHPFQVRDDSSHFQPAFSGHMIFHSKYSSLVISPACNSC